MIDSKYSHNWIICSGFSVKLSIHGSIINLDRIARCPFIMIISVECNSAPQELEQPYKCSANPGIAMQASSQPSSGRESVPLVGWWWIRPGTAGWNDQQVEHESHSMLLLLGWLKTLLAASHPNPGNCWQDTSPARPHIPPTSQHRHKIHSFHVLNLHI